MSSDREGLADAIERQLAAIKVCRSPGMASDLYARLAALLLAHQEELIAALRQSQSPDRDEGERMREAAKRVCHEEQMTEWSSQLVASLAMRGFLQDEHSYEEVLEIHHVAASEIRSIVESAFTHPELDVLPLAQEEKP